MWSWEVRGLGVQERSDPVSARGRHNINTTRHESASFDEIKETDLYTHTYMFVCMCVCLYVFVGLAAPTIFFFILVVDAIQTVSSRQVNLPCII